MRKNYVKLPLLIAAIYFGGNLHAQSTQDTATKENKIEEVVVIGYGSAKKVDLTSAITTVKAADIVKTPSGQATQSLQGKVAGVQIVVNGSPGEAPKMNIRGIHSLQGDNQPLYVVDGLFVNNIEFLNPNDIQDFTILKDASASAIYGVLAANGVVIITTKGGNYNRKAKFSYDTYYGAQYANNVTKMANAEQYTNFALESGSAAEIANINTAIARFGRSRTNPNLPNANTDWYNEALRIAPIQSHSLSVDGGSEKIAYSLSGNFFSQDGILKMKNSYERFNVRAKVDAKATNWLNVGTVINYTRGEKYDDEGSAWQQIYYAVPIMPVFDPLFTDATVRPYSDAKVLGYREHDNPFSLMDNVNKLGVQKTINFNTYAEVSILPKELIFKTALSYNNRSFDERLMELPYFVNSDFQRTIKQSSITRNNATYEDYILDNTITWTKSFGEHDITALAGTSFADQSYKFLSVKGFFDDTLPFSRDNESTWYLNNTSPNGRISSEGQPYRYYRTSYFGRLSYKFKNRYIAYGTIRREGSNKFPNQKTINLPAVGLGWVASEESFLKNVSWINLLKFRAGWGRLANDAVNASRPSTAFAVNSVFADTFVPAFQFTTYKDDVRREYTEETNVGLSSEFLERRLTLEADYFIKDTKSLVIPVQPKIGDEVSYANVGTMRNKGFEISAGWRDKIGENWGYSINGNFSQIKNEITDLYNQAFIARGSGDFPQRLVVGQPIDVFYGFVLDGVYQNQAEVDADPTAVFANSTAGQGAGTVKPGYFKYKDLNGDGKIDDSDRTYLGSPVPTYYYGGSVAVNYKGWDVSVAFYGQGGNVILNRNRTEVIRTAGRNIDADFAINRWHGEGTTNEYVSSEGYRKSWNNQKLSDFWLQKGDFFRVQNIQLGYTLKTTGVPEMRFTLTADRPFTWSRSKNLMNPEVPNTGVNLDLYPTPSVVSVGYSIKF